MIIREVSRSIRVPRSAEVVWSAATDWTAQGEWMIGTTVRVTGGDGRGPGSELAAFTGLGGVGVLDTMEIVEWRPPVRCSVRHTGTVVRGTGGFRVAAIDADTSEFTWWERFELPTLLAVGWPLARPAVESGLRRSLRAFVRFCERFEETDRGRG